MARQLTVQENKLHCCKGVTCDELHDFFVPVVWHPAQSCGLSVVFVSTPVVGSKHASRHTSPSIMILMQAGAKQSKQRLTSKQT